MQAVVDSCRGERGAESHCVRERDYSCDLYIVCLILTDKYSAARKLKLELYEHHVAAPDCSAAEPRAEWGDGPARQWVVCFCAIYPSGKVR